jgi:hypothetical protein
MLHPKCQGPEVFWIFSDCGILALVIKLSDYMQIAMLAFNPTVKFQEPHDMS